MRRQVRSLSPKLHRPTKMLRSPSHAKTWLCSRNVAIALLATSRASPMKPMVMAKNVWVPMVPKSQRLMASGEPT